MGALTRSAFSAFFLSVLASAALAQTPTSGVRLTYNETTVAKDSQGRTAQSSSTTVIWVSASGEKRTERYDSNHKLQSVELFNENTHRAVRLDYRTKTATNLPMVERASEAMAANLQEGQSGGQRQFIGTRKILGLDCRGTRATSPTGASVEGWGCPDSVSGQVIFGGLHFWTPDGMQMQRDLVKVERPATMDSGLFEIPSGFTVTAIAGISSH